MAVLLSDELVVSGSVEVVGPVNEAGRVGTDGAAVEAAVEDTGVAAEVAAGRGDAEGAAAPPLSHGFGGEGMVDSEARTGEECGEGGGQGGQMRNA